MALSISASELQVMLLQSQEVHPLSVCFPSSIKEDFGYSKDSEADDKALVSGDGEL